MADSAVSFLVQTLTSLAADEFTLLKSVGDEILEIKNEFSSMQAFLKDADAKEDSDERVKEWVKQVRHVAYKTEDVLDEYQLLQQRQTTCDFLKNLKTKHQLASRIKAIKSELSEISRRKDQYDLSSREQGSTSQASDVQGKRDPRKDALYVKEVQLVGIHESRKDLVRWLVNGDQETSTLSVYGKGGLGKTTLVKKVFDNHVVKAHFPYRAWATISDRFDVKKVLKDLIGQIPSTKSETFTERFQFNDMDATKLTDILRNRLQGERYILVFDDIWKIDAWKELKRVLPEGMLRGNRVVVTTRFHHIASECKSESKYSRELELPPLASDDDLKLFCKVAFSSDDLNSCPYHLKEIVQKFLGKCTGLPLAIISIASLLRTKPTVEWNQLFKNLGFLMKSDEKLKDLYGIISLSYSDLPFHLKSCFLYLCIFPDDFSISCRKLFQLWVAEGFVERKPDMNDDITTESIAKGYLDELINRCLVQVDVLEDITGRVKTCCVHDVWRDFIILKAHEQAFVAHLDSEGLHGQMIGRRLSVLRGVKNMYMLLKEKQIVFSHLRCLISFDRISKPDQSLEVIKRCKLLRVLILDVSFYSNAIFPRKLFNLRYLCVTGSGTMSSFPRYIGTLPNLEVLEMRGVRVHNPQLPKEILKLKHLRCIYVRQRKNKSGEACMTLPDGIEKLTNMEHLAIVDANVEGSSSMLKSLGKLTRMRKLMITGLKEEDGKHLCTSIEMMEQLCSLSIIGGELDSSSIGAGSERYVDLDNLTSPPQYLEKLKLMGEPRSGRIPSWFSKLQNVIKLSLWYTHIADDSFLKCTLQELPILAKLVLHAAFKQEELCFEKGGFPRLKQLHLGDPHGDLRKITVKEGAMPSIEWLRFNDCGKLKEAPFGIQYLTTLKTIQLDFIPGKIRDEIKKQIWEAGNTPRILEPNEFCFF